METHVPIFAKAGPSGLQNNRSRNLPHGLGGLRLQQDTQNILFLFYYTSTKRVDRKPFDITRSFICDDSSTHSKMDVVYTLHETPMESLEFGRREEETTFYDDDEYIVDYNRPQYEYILYYLRNLDEIKIVCSEYWDQKPLVWNGGRFDVPRVQPRVRSWYYDSKRVDAYMVEDYYDQMHAINSQFKVPTVKMVHRVAPMVTDNENLMYAGRDIEALVEESSGDGVADVSEEDSEDD
ncbi:hypothetical protein B0J14DRAFT_652880 [Halenospora varia]|nr:hypothetical protein B0J14DRAFT_652880 [Halenospora varia]